jgi:hypothetical protein
MIIMIKLFPVQKLLHSKSISACELKSLQGIDKGYHWHVQSWLSHTTLHPSLLWNEEEDRSYEGGGMGKE